MAGSSTTLVIRILADAKQAAATMKGASTNAGKFATGLNRATLPALAVVGALGAMGKAAAEDAQGQALLANSLRKSAGASAAQVQSVEDWISATTLATGVADDQLRPALATLSRATGDVTTSQKAMTTVLDVSAATGKDTQAVANALAKAYGGNAASLGKLVPGLNKAILKSGDMTKIMAELARVTGGSAAVAADTAAGKWKRTQTAFAETKESIGAGLLPVINKLSSSLATFGTWAANNTGTVTTLAVALGVLAGGVLAVSAAMRVIRAATLAWQAAQWLLNIAMDANPIGATIAVIVLLVAAFVLAYKKSETFRKIVQAAWNGIKVAASAAWNFIKSYVFLPYILYFKLWKAAAKLAIDAVIKIWEGLKAGFKSVWDWLKSNVFDPLINIFDKVVDAVQTVIDWIGKIKIPKAVTDLLGKAASLFSLPAPPPPAPTPRSATGRAAAAPAAATATGGADQAALASLSGDAGGPQVIVQLADRKLADLIDVRIRANARAAARNLRRRSVVVV